MAAEAGQALERERMGVSFDRKIYFDAVRQKPFSGSMTQSQVDGQNWLLDEVEAIIFEDLSWVVRDMRFLAYAFATTFHETGQTMQPIEEWGKGQGHSYGQVDPETGQTYYGRGYVQLTWRDNYRRATERLHLSKTTNDLEWHAEKALDPQIAADILYQGMTEGWFTGKKLSDYFDEDSNDPVNARAIINNDVSKMGKTVAGYHQDFLDALQAAWLDKPKPGFNVVHIAIDTPPGVTVSVVLNGEQIVAGLG